MKEINKEKFEAWLFSQPPEREFDYGNVEGDCAICSFVRETTNIKATGGAETVRLGLHGSGAPKIPIPGWLRSVNEPIGVLLVRPLTIANMQRRYSELFPEVEGEASNKEAPVRVNV